MSSLLDTFLNILGFYNLTAEEYYDIYGYTYYVPSRLQLFDQTTMADAELVDVTSQQIAVLIQDALDANEEYIVVYDFTAFFDAQSATIGQLQRDRVIDAVLDSLEKKGYRVVQDDGAPGNATIRWAFKVFRMFKVIRPTQPPV